MPDPAEASEALLAQLFTDASLRERFRREPMQVGEEFGLDQSTLTALAATDWVGLDLAARSYAHKRAHRGRVKAWWQRLRGT